MILTKVSHSGAGSSEKIKVIDNVFEGIKFQIKDRATLVMTMFKSFRQIEVKVISGVFFINLRGLSIATIKGNTLELTPGILINSDKKLFQTYNKLLRTLVKDGSFLKLYGKHWVLCKEEA